MKLGMVLFVAIVLVSFVPSYSVAQNDILGSVLGTYGSLSLSDAFAPLAWGGPVSYLLGGSNAGLPETTFLVGWMDARKGTRVSFDTKGLDVFDLLNIDQIWSNRGLFLGTSTHVALTSGLDLNLEGWVLVPHSTSAEFISIFGPISGGISAQRSWKTDTRWWFVDAFSTRTVVGGTVGVIGIRYDYHDVHFRDTINDPNFPSSETDTADVTISTVLPYFGLQYSTDGPRPNLSVRVIGCPWIISSVQQRQTWMTFNPTWGYRDDFTARFSRGYFVELFAQYGYNFASNFQVGAFAKAQLLHGSGSTNYDTWAIHSGGFRSAPFNVTLERQTYILGAHLSVDFSLF